ncbi:hypothetical protein HYC85_019560 [Camellia sinensis]|uniref:Uncharacterized protein n=1 Tax=Camellia sinensis TaxID=4442 RepID=A0A7J7GR74_CAMSI|nr:hypothetical protein HYC85_019560 [Camellia sinensis]
MYGQRPRFRPGGGDRGAPPPPAPLLNYHQNPNLFLQNPTPLAPNQYVQNPNYPLQNPNYPLQNPNYLLQNPNYQLQNPNFAIHTSNFPIQVPNVPPQQFPNQGVQPRPPRPNESLERVERAVVKARRDLLAAGESVSAWKVSQAALLSIQAESWDSLGMQMQQVPSLNRLIMTEGKFITLSLYRLMHLSTVSAGVRRITSLYDLELAICNSEGVKQFEELELGPLVRHPLVVHYFSVSSDVTKVFKITSEEIISCLCEFMGTHDGEEIDVKEFLDFIAKKRSVTGWENLSVRIQSLGYVILLLLQLQYFNLKA